jgi:hypothetical protein
MIDNQIFDLEKIKQLASPLEELEGKIEKLESIPKEYKEVKKKAHVNLKDKEFLENIENVVDLLIDINEELKEISKNNANQFLQFQDHLIEKYKDIFKEKIKELSLSQQKTKKIGLYLIDQKVISKIISTSKYIPSIGINQWSSLLDSLNENSLFSSTIKKVSNFFDTLTEKKLQKELSKIPPETDDSLIEDYKEVFLKNRSESPSFKDFLRHIEEKLSQEKLQSKRDIIEKTKKEEQLNSLREKQQEQQRSYQDYFKYSNREFERRRRRKKRKKLSDVTNQTEITEDFEISEDVAEKIERFKSKFNKGFKEKYLISREDEADPLDIVRERKKKKHEEYRQHLKKFKEEEEEK